MEIVLIRIANVVVKGHSPNAEDIKLFRPEQPSSLDRVNPVAVWLKTHGFSEEVVQEFMGAKFTQLDDALHCTTTDLKEISPTMSPAERIKFRRLAGDHAYKLRLTLPSTYPTFTSKYDGTKAEFGVFFRWILRQLTQYIQVDAKTLGQSILGYVHLDEVKLQFMSRLLYENVSNGVLETLQGLDGIRLFTTWIAYYGRQTTADVAKFLSQALLHPATMNNSVEAITWLNRTRNEFNAMGITGELLALSGLLNSFQNDRLNFLFDKLQRFSAQELKQKWHDIELDIQSAFDLQENGQDEFDDDVNEVGEDDSFLLYLDSGAKQHCLNTKTPFPSVQASNKRLTAFNGGSLNIAGQGDVYVHPVGHEDITFSLGVSYFVPSGKHSLLAPIKLVKQKKFVKGIWLALTNSYIKLASGKKIPLILVPQKGWFLRCSPAEKPASRTSVASE